jgi:hypothetical protein
MSSIKFDGFTEALSTSTSRRWALKAFVRTFISMLATLGSSLGVTALAAAYSWPWI